MASNATIGALRVDLGLNSAQFTAGLKKAETGLTKFGAVAARGLAMVASAATVAAGALGYAVKGAIDHADELSKASQKAGLTVEALSRLEYAAKLSDVSLGDLTGGLQKLSKAMADSLLSKTSTSATAFKALGISVTDASGNLRNSNDVFAEVADRFSKMEDGATKTSLAMMLFGKSGASLIPLLNEGAVGLKQMADESDRVGATISGDTARAAEEFNDNLTRLGEVLQGIVNKIMKALLPALSAAAKWLSTLDGNTVAIGGSLAIVTGLLGPVALGFGGIAKAASLAAGAIVAVNNAIVGLVAKLGALPSLGIAILTFYFGGTQALGANEDNVVQAMRDKAKAVKDAVASLRDQLGAGTTAASGVYDGIFNDVSYKAPTFDALGTTTGGASDKLETLDLGISDVNEGLTEMQKLGQQVASTLADAFTNVAEAFITGGDALGAIADQLGNIGKQLLNQGLQMLFSQLFGGMSLFGGGGLTSGWAGGAGYMSFDGGGYTGSGSRAGGMDGKGGFLAMLHPDETVLDHTRGQGAGGDMNFTISGSKQDAAAIANAVSDTLRQQLPGAIARYNQNPYRRG